MGLNTDPSLLPLFWDGFFWAAGFLFSSFLFLGKKQKLLLIYRQVICMCFQVYGLSNIDLLRCVCMFVVPRSLPHSIFVYIARVLFVQLPLFESQTDSVLSTIFCLSVFLSECVCLCFLLLHESKRRERGKEGRREKERTTRQIQTNTTATSHSVIYFPTRHYNQIILGRP